MHYKLNPHQDDYTHDILDLLAKTKIDDKAEPTDSHRPPKKAPAAIDFDDDDFDF